MNTAIEKILDFWFGALDGRGLAASEKNALWFSANPETDEFCRKEFGELLGRARDGALDDWAGSDEGLVALIVLLDQFSRNIHRGTPQAFAGDSKGLALALSAIAAQRHLDLPPIHQVFLFLPLEHSEDADHQRHCVELFEALEASMQEDQFAGFTRYARAHREVIEKFGRFPHRNAILGRSSTPEEEAYLETHGGF